METNEHPQDFLSESDLEESNIDVTNELEDIITDIDIYFTNIARLLNKYLKALENMKTLKMKIKEIFSKSI